MHVGRENGLILIVDDNVDACRMLSRYLRCEGFAAECAFSPTEALRKLVDSRPRLLILDQMMPEMSGVDLLKQIRAIPAHAWVPALFYSASSNDEDRYSAAALGAKWLTKGASLENLVDEVRREYGL